MPVVSTHRVDSRTVAVRIIGRGVVGEVVRIDGPRGRPCFAAYIDRCSWGRFTRQADAIAEVALRSESIQRGNAFLGAR